MLVLILLLFPQNKERSFYLVPNQMKTTNYDQKLVLSVELKPWEVLNFQNPTACENNLEMSHRRQ